MFFVDPAGNYYEGDQVHPLDAPVPKRPDPTFLWNFGTSSWQQSAPLAAIVSAIAQLTVDDAAVRTSALVQQLLNASDAQIAAFVAAHSTADAGTQGLIVLLARIVRILGNRSL